MNIAFFTDMFLPQINGPATVVVDMAKKLADRGHRVYIIAPDFPNLKELSHRNVIVRRCASVPALIYKGLRLTSFFDPAVLKFVRDNRIDIVHFHTPATLGMQAILVARLLGLPLVGTFHGFFMHPEYLKHAKMNYEVMHKLAWKYSNFFYNQCDIVVCSSEGTKKELLEKKCSRPVRVVPLGVDTGIFDSSKSAGIRKALNRKGKLVLSVGRIAYEKNMPHLLECFALALRKVPTAKLLIVGDGPQLADVKAHAKALKISGKVVFTGGIPHDKLVKSGIFGACDVFVTASTTETGPLTVLEAQANGLVCVGVKGKGMNLIKNNINGYVLGPNDREGFANAIAKLLSDEKLYRRMKKATMKSIVSYDAGNIAAEWEKIYRSVLDMRRKNRQAVKVKT